MENKFYSLPQLTYGYDELRPFISKEQLAVHYERHHSNYIKTANAVLEKLDLARQTNPNLDYQTELKSLSFNIGGHVLHSLFWTSLLPVKNGGGKISNKMTVKINNNFGSLERFKKEFTATALGIEGSGWGALIYDRATNRLMCAPIEKHNVLNIPGVENILVLDVFEHAYYIDYRNDRSKYIEAFWQVINWKGIEKKLLKILDDWLHFKIL